MSDEYYMQDTRQYVGNDMLWWAQGGAGYTTDIRNAHVFTKARAMAQHGQRESDVPWPKAYIDGKIKHVIDVQNVDRELNRGLLDVSR